MYVQATHLTLSLCDRNIQSLILMLVPLIKIEFHPLPSLYIIQHTSKFIRKIQPTLATFNTIKVYPGTPLYDNPDQYGILAEDMMWFENPDWNKRPMIYTKDLSPEQIAFYSRKMMVDMLI